MSFLGNGFLGSHCRLRMPSYTFTGFHRWKHMYNQKYQVFHPRGVSIPVCYYSTQVFFINLFNHATLLDFIQLTEPTHKITKYGVYLQSCTHTHVMQCLRAYAMQCAIACQFHAPYVINVIWKYTIHTSYHTSWTIISTCI